MPSRRKNLNSIPSHLKGIKLTGKHVTDNGPTNTKSDNKSNREMEHSILQSRLIFSQKRGNTKQKQKPHHKNRPSKDPHGGALDQKGMSESISCISDSIMPEPFSSGFGTPPFHSLQATIFFLHHSKTLAGISEPGSPSS